MNYIFKVLFILHPCSILKVKIHFFAVGFQQIVLWDDDLSIFGVLQIRGDYIGLFLRFSVLYPSDIFQNHSFFQNFGGIVPGVFLIHFIFHWETFCLSLLMPSFVLGLVDIWILVNRFKNVFLYQIWTFQGEK